MDTKSSARRISSSFRVIFTMNDLAQELHLKSGTIKVTISDTTKSIPIPCKEAISLDFPDVQAGSTIKITVDDQADNFIGWSETELPDVIFENHETEVNQSVRFYLNNTENEYIMAKIYLIFLNKGIFKEKAKQINSKSKSNIKQKPSSPDKRPLSRSTSSPLKKTQPRSATKIDDVYLSAIIDGHSLHLKSVVDEHNSLHNFVFYHKTTSTVLTPNIAADSLHEYTPTKLTVTKTEKTPRESIGIDSYYKTPTKSPSRIHSARVSIVRESEDFNGDETKKLSHRSAKRDPEEVQFNRAKLEASMEKLRLSTPSIMSARDSTPGEQETKETYKEPEFGTNKFFIGKPKEKPSHSESTTEHVSFCKKSSTEEFLASEQACSEMEVANANANANANTNTANAVDTSKAEVEYLQGIIKSLEGQLNKAQAKDNEVSQLKKSLEESERARRKLQESVLEKASSLENENSELRRQIMQLQNEKEESAQQNKSFNMSFDNSQMMSDKKQASAKSNEINELKEELTAVKAALEKSEADRMEVQKNYRTSLEVFEKSLESTEKTMEKIAQEKRTAVIALGQCKQELNKEKLDHQETLDKLVTLRSQIAGLEHYKELVKSLEVHRDELNIKLLESKKSSRSDGDESYMTSKNEGLEENIKALEVKNEQLNKELNESKLKVSELNAKVASLEQVVYVNSDMKQQLETTSTRLNKEAEEKEALKRQFEDYLSNQNQTHTKVFELEKSVSQMKTAVVEKDQKYVHLKKILISMGKSGDLYIPQRNDTVDNMLADSLNLQEDLHKYRPMFVWEGPGVYQFGTKKVFAKVDGGNLTIRVGGGFIKVEEFLDAYGPLELEKAARSSNETPTKVNGKTELRRSFAK